jgi:hypothetical protein
MKPGEMYRRVGPGNCGDILTGDVVVVQKVRMVHGAMVDWAELLILRLGVAATLPVNPEYWERVEEAEPCQ